MRAKRRPTLTGGNPQLPSALKSLTAVFGMGTGVTSLPSSLDYLLFKTFTIISYNVLMSSIFERNLIFLFLQNWIIRTLCISQKFG